MRENTGKTQKQRAPGASGSNLHYLLAFLFVFVGAGHVEAQTTENVILVTIDGLRWQEVFRGADQRLITKDSGNVLDVEAVNRRYVTDSAQQRRKQLMPFLWNVIATRGQILGDPKNRSPMRVTNGRFFSYPGYNEILSGQADRSIDSNAKKPNRNVTVLEWLNRKQKFRDKVAVFASWDVFPYILNTQRSKIYTNAGWQELEFFQDSSVRDLLNQHAGELPHYWNNVRYDMFTVRGAIEYLHTKQPCVLYVAMGETDDWAHAGRYDLYLDAARRSDDYLKSLWQTVQDHPSYAGKTTLVVTTDHGRGDTREGWKSHGVGFPGSDMIWAAAIGPDTPGLGVRENVATTQSQIAATVAALLEEDFAASREGIAPPLPDFVKHVSNASCPSSAVKEEEENRVFTSLTHQGADLDWLRVTDKAGWQPRDSQGELVFDDHLWIFGGWFNSFEAPPQDVWKSADGERWDRVTANAPWKHSDLSMSIAFDEKMWFMGGWYNGRLPGHSASNQVWSSLDGALWTQAAAADWSPRIASALVEFNEKMWLIGGTENYYFGDERSLKNDVWFSADGVSWQQITADAGWSPRAYHQAAVLNDRIYVFGGGNYVPEYHALNDVWSSGDGVHWRQEKSAPWNPRLWFSSVVYRDRIWVLGGWSNNPSRNWGDVWYTKDGSNWHQLESNKCWKARHEHSAFVFQDKIFVAGGHAKPLSSEVWSLEVPEDWFPSTR